MKLVKLVQTLAISTILILPVMKTLATIPSETLIESNAEVEISLNLPASPNENGSDGSGTVGGAQRGRCQEINNNNNHEPPLTMLMSNNINHLEASRNFNGNSLYWYLPDQHNAQKAEFLILNNNGQYVYFQEFEIPQNQEGLVRLDLPSNLPLSEDKVYKWELTLVCNEVDRSGDVFVTGFIELLNNNEQRQLSSELALARNNPNQENASSIEEAQANVYIRHNLWHRAYDILSRTRKQVELLEYFGIEGEVNVVGVVNENGFSPIR